MNPRFLIVPSLSFLTLVALAAALVLLSLLTTASGRARLRAFASSRASTILATGWTVSLIATGGSLYLSEGLGLEPCRLCWYQRIAMYPLVVILGVALMRGDREVWKTALPLAGVGTLVSAYHVAVQYLPGIEIGACSVSAPCSARYLIAYGFVTIPVMAGSAFLLVAALLLVHGPLARRR